MKPRGFLCGCTKYLLPHICVLENCTRARERELGRGEGGLGGGVMERCRHTFVVCGGMCCYAHRHYRGRRLRNFASQTAACEEAQQTVFLDGKRDKRGSTPQKCDLIFPGYRFVWLWLRSRASDCFSKGWYKKEGQTNPSEGAAQSEGLLVFEARVMRIYKCGRNRRTWDKANSIQLKKSPNNGSIELAVKCSDKSRG